MGQEKAELAEGNFRSILEQWERTQNGHLQAKASCSGYQWIHSLGKTMQCIRLQSIFVFRDAQSWMTINKFRFFFDYTGTIALC